MRMINGVNVFDDDEWCISFARKIHSCISRDPIHHSNSLDDNRIINQTQRIQMDVLFGTCDGHFEFHVQKDVWINWITVNYNWSWSSCWAVDVENVKWVTHSLKHDTFVWAQVSLSFVYVQLTVSQHISADDVMPFAIVYLKNVIFRLQSVVWSKVGTAHTHTHSIVLWEL